MIKEFKEFAIKWNMIDMAIWIVIWAAFSTIVKSLIDDIIMPIVSWIFKLPDFSNLFFILSNPSWERFASVNAAREAWASVLAYWLFINVTLAFLMVSVTLFFIVKWINKLKKNKIKEDEEPKISELDVLVDIRDYLKSSKWK